MTTNWRSISAEEAKQHKLYGVGGWLALFAFSLFAGFLGDFGAINSVALKNGMSVSKFLSVDLPGILFIKIALMIGFLKVISIYALLFSKHPGFRTASTYILIGYLPALLLVGAFTPFPGLGEFFVLTLVPWIASCAVWVTYLQRSERVRVTFEHTIEVAPNNAIGPSVGTFKPKAKASARTEKGWRWFKLVAIVMLATFGIKLLFAFGASNSLNRAGLALVGAVGGTIVLGGIAYFLGWLTGEDNPQETPAASPLAGSSAVSDTSAVDATYEKIDHELKTDELDRATWTRAQGDAEGNAERTKALYIKYRAQRLLAASPDGPVVKSRVENVRVGKSGTKFNSLPVVAMVGILGLAAVVVTSLWFSHETPKGGFIPLQNTDGFIPYTPPPKAPIEDDTKSGNVFDQFDDKTPTPSKQKNLSQDTLVPSKSIEGLQSERGIDQAEIDAKAVTARAIRLETERLDFKIPNWRAIVGAKDSNNPYRQWLAKQSAEYQAEMNLTNSDEVIYRSIAKFRADTE